MSKQNTFDTSSEPDFVNIWEEAKSYLQSKITAFEFDMWIKGLEPLMIKDNCLILESKTQGNKAVVMKKADIIEDALKKVSRVVTKFNVVVESEEEYLELKKEKEVVDKELDLPKKAQKRTSFAFNPRFTFDNYVIGPSNEFTVAAAKAVAARPGTNYNPLFIYGGVGLGKTHLLHAIGNAICELHPELNVVYVTIEEFTNEFIETVKQNELSFNIGFRNKYRTADVLIIDDIQSIIGKNRVQEEFFHTFNALKSQNKQIVLSSDRPPKEFKTLLEDRIVSRFEDSLFTDIGIPEIETRIAILKKKCYMDRQVVDDDALYYIAEGMTSNVRELEGFLSRCVFYAGLLKKPKVTLEIAKEALKNYITAKKVTYDSDKIIEKVCSYFEVSKNQLLGKDRRKELSYARQIAMYLLDELMNMPYTSIGKIFGKDHATVIYCKNKVSSELETNKLLEVQIKDLKGLCGAHVE